MRMIRTVLGDVPAEEIGVTDSHDHLIRSVGPEVKQDPAFLMDDLDAAKREYSAFLKAGGRTWSAWTLSATAGMFQRC